MTNKLDLAANALRWSGGGAVLRSTPVWQGMLVLNYHRIGNPDASPFDRDVFSARQEAFDRQVAFLKRSFDVITPADITDARARGRGRYVMITFDDGYRDNVELAFPVLSAHNVPATFFICTGFIDRPRIAWWDEIAWMVRTSSAPALPAGEWFDAEIPLESADRTDAIRRALRRFKELPGERTSAYLDYLRSATGRTAGDEIGTDLWMTWEMIRRLHTAGMTIGAHTVHHHLLGRLPDGDQEREIVESRDRIAAEIGIAPRAFAYPVGSKSAFNDATKRLLARHGFDFAFSFYGGFQRFEPFDPYDIRRAHVGHIATQPMFEAMVTLPGLFARW
ncbi:MAG: polysaccharide deacetylase family protein [Thermomicrobiales bacterium]|nr:polysaccharide deacetylase family protein [Thermomicrobiales bacterium]